MIEKLHISSGASGEEMYGPYLDRTGKRNTSGNDIIVEPNSGIRMHRVLQNFPLQRFITSTLEGIIPVTHMVSRTDEKGELRVYSTELRRIRSGESLTRKEVVDFFAARIFIATFFKDGDHFLAFMPQGEGFAVRGRAGNVGRDTDGKIGFFDFGISGFEYDRLSAPSRSEVRSRIAAVIEDATCHFRGRSYNPFTEKAFSESVTIKSFALLQDFINGLAVRGPYQNRFERALRSYNKLSIHADERLPLSLSEWRAYAVALRDMIPGIIDEAFHITKLPPSTK